MERKLEFSRRFLKQYRKVDPKIGLAFNSRLKLFMREPHNHKLHNHKLSGKYRGYSSINITGDWRAVFKEYKQGKIEIVEFQLLETHSDLYR